MPYFIERDLQDVVLGVRRDRLDDFAGTREAEAAWFGGVLMLPDFQALDVARTGMPVDAATEQYELSREMLVFRLRATGALKRFPKYLAAA
jgi:hypothetical protein